MTLDIKEKWNIELLKNYIGLNVKCSYLPGYKQKIRITTILTGVSNNHAEIDYVKNIPFTGKNNLNDMEFKLHLWPMSDYRDINGEKMNELNCDITDEIEITGLADKLSFYSTANFRVVRLLLNAHANVFNLPDHMWIDKNTLK